MGRGYWILADLLLKRVHPPKYLGTAVLSAYNLRSRVSRFSRCRIVDIIQCTEIIADGKEITGAIPHMIMRKRLRMGGVVECLIDGGSVVDAEIENRRT